MVIYQKLKKTIVLISLRYSVLIFLIAIPLLITCDRSYFFNKESSDDVTQLEIKGELFLPPNLLDIFPEYTKESAGKIAFQEKIEFTQDWNDEIGGFTQDWNDEIGYIPDWDENIDYLKGWDEKKLAGLNNRALTLFEKTTTGEVTTGLIPTGPKGLFKFQIKSSSLKKSLFIIGLGTPDQIKLHGLVTAQKPVFLDLYSDFAFGLTTKLFDRFFKNQLSEKITLFIKINNSIYDSVKDLSLDSSEALLVSKRINLVKKIEETRKNSILIKLNENVILSATDLELIFSEYNKDLANQLFSEISKRPPVTDQTGSENQKPLLKDKKGFVEIQWISIKGAAFSFGSEDPEDYNYLCKPYTAGLSDFQIMASKVTAHHYKECVDTGICKEPVAESTYSEESGDKEFMTFNKTGKENHPVNFINWEEASAYCGYLGKKLGKTGKLPTHAQWQYAARGNTGNIFPWGNEMPSEKLNKLANCTEEVCFDGYPATSEVGLFTPSVPFGLYDMAGNTYEWVMDYEDSASYQFCTDPESLKTNSYNTTSPKKTGDTYTKGGGFLSETLDMHVASHRNSFPRLNRSDRVGFRCVLQ